MVIALLILLLLVAGALWFLSASVEPVPQRMIVEDVKPDASR